MAAVFRVKLYFSRYYKLSSIERKQSTCQRKHRVYRMDCQQGVVYKVQVASRQVYIGHAGRYFNDSALERKIKTKYDAAKSLLARYLEECSGCDVLREVSRVQDKAKE